MGKGERETVVIAIGGSLIVPDEIDVNFLHAFRDVVSHLIEDQGKRVALVVGGGKTARRYQAALRSFPHCSNEDLDWVGIKSICLNGELLLRAYGDFSIFSRVLERPDEVGDIGDEDLIIVGAHEPGYSSDTDAVLFAKELGSKRIVNFSNVSYVYDSDPRENPEAKPLKKLTWDEYRSLIPSEWKPGLSLPFDPVATKLAQEAGMELVVLGPSLENVRSFFRGETFDGTIIRD